MSHCLVSQDAPEVKSSGVPVPVVDESNTRWQQNSRAMRSFSGDMPWDPYKALLHSMLQSSVAVLVVGGGVFLSSVIETRRGSVG